VLGASLFGDNQNTNRCGQESYEGESVDGREYYQKIPFVPRREIWRRITIATIIVIVTKIYSISEIDYLDKKHGRVNNHCQEPN